MSKKVYISGPMSGKKDFNYPAFHEAEKILYYEGCNPVNPAKLSHDHGKTWEEYMREDLKSLCDCQEIVMLPGWEDSRGAMLELIVARALGIKVRFLF